jgi:hypothetical protein
MQLRYAVLKEPRMKVPVALVVASLVPLCAQAQQPAQQAPANACLSQHVEAPGVSAAALITRGYDIKAAIPGGLWVQKDREVYFCNSGRALDNEVLCWRLREPVKGQPC